MSRGLYIGESAQPTEHQHLDAYERAACVACRTPRPDLTVQVARDTTREDKIIRLETAARIASGMAGRFLGLSDESRATIVAESLRLSDELIKRCGL